MAEAVSRDFFATLFCLLFFYCKIFNQLKNKHCNINIEVSFSCSTVVKFYNYVIVECIELSWLSIYLEKVRSSQAVIVVLNWVKCSFSLWVSLTWCSYWFKFLWSNSLLKLMYSKRYSYLLCDFLSSKYDIKYSSFERTVFNC